MGPALLFPCSTVLLSTAPLDPLVIPAKFIPYGGGNPDEPPATKPVLSNIEGLALT